MKFSEISECVMKCGGNAVKFSEVRGNVVKFSEVCGNVVKSTEVCGNVVEPSELLRLRHVGHRAN